MELKEYVDAIRLRVPGVDPGAIERGLQPSLQELSKRIAESPYPRKGLLRKTFSGITVTDGAADVPATVRIENVDSAAITPDATWPTLEQLQWLANPADITRPPDLGDYAFFAYQDNQLLVFDNAGQPLTGTISMVANYEPVLSDITDLYLKELLIKIGTGEAPPILPAVPGT